jgi:hypothetical protein
VVSPAGGGLVYLPVHHNGAPRCVPLRWTDDRLSMRAHVQPGRLEPIPPGAPIPYLYRLHPPDIDFSMGVKPQGALLKLSDLAVSVLPYREGYYQGCGGTLRIDDLFASEASCEAALAGGHRPPRNSCTIFLGEVLTHARADAASTHQAARRLQELARRGGTVHWQTPDGRECQAGHFRPDPLRPGEYHLFSRWSKTSGAIVETYFLAAIGNTNVSLAGPHGRVIRQPRIGSLGEGSLGCASDYRVRGLGPGYVQVGPLRWYLDRRACLASLQAGPVMTAGCSSGDPAAPGRELASSRARVP